MQYKIGRGLLGADGQDLFALDFDFNAERRANAAALHDGTANPDVAGEIDRFQWIVKRVTAGIADERMGSVAILVIGKQPVEIGDVLELAIPIIGLAGKSPIAGGGRGGGAGKPDDRGGNTLAGDGAADEEIRRGPGLGESGHFGDGGIVLISVRQQRIGIGRRRRDFNLSRRLDARSLSGTARTGKPAHGQKKEQREHDHADNEGKHRITMASWRRNGYARDRRHFRFKTRRWC